MSFNGGLITFGAGTSGYLPVDPVEELLNGEYPNHSDIAASGFLDAASLAASGFMKTPNSVDVVADYTMQPDDGYVFADAGGGTLTVTLEGAVAASGLMKAVKRMNTGGGGNRVLVYAADGFDASAVDTIVLRRRGAAVTVVSNGSSWMIV